MIEAIEARLVTKTLFIRGKNLKEVINRAAYPGIQMFFTSAGLRVLWLGQKLIIPYNHFTYILEGNEVASEEPVSNAKKLKGAEKLSDSRQEKKHE